MNSTAVENEECSSDDYSGSYESVREPIEFCTGVALTLLVPTLFYCVAIGQAWPFWLMACNDAVGVALGLAIYKMSSDELPSCVPVVRFQQRQRQAHDLKKAA